MINNRVVGTWLTPDPVQVGVFELQLLGDDPEVIAFDRATVDNGNRDVTLFTWGTHQARSLGRALA